MGSEAYLYSIIYCMYNLKGATAFLAARQEQQNNNHTSYGFLSECPGLGGRVPIFTS